MDIHQISDEFCELQQVGYMVIKSVASEASVLQATESLWSYLETNSPGLSRHTPFTWTLWPENFCGIINHSIGHSKFMWDIRTLPGVLRTFAKIWQVQPEDLLASFDGCNASPPKESAKLTAPWPHVDQAQIGLQCIQGFVALTDSLSNSEGGLYILRGSHMQHNKIFSSSEQKRAMQFSWDELKQIYGDLRIEKINCKAGDLVLWDSRTCHWAQEPQTGCGVRMAAYVCFTPRVFASKENLERKKAAFVKGKMTSHLPHIVHYVEDYYPAVKSLTGYQENPLTSTYVTDQIARLAGFNDLGEYYQYQTTF